MHRTWQCDVCFRLWVKFRSERSIFDRKGTESPIDAPLHLFYFIHWRQHTLNIDHDCVQWTPFRTLYIVWWKKGLNIPHRVSLYSNSTLAKALFIFFLVWFQHFHWDFNHSRSHMRFFFQVIFSLLCCNLICWLFFTTSFSLFIYGLYFSLFCRNFLFAADTDINIKLSGECLMLLCELLYLLSVCS